MSELSDDVWDLLADLDLDGVAVVGLSMGGLVAMEMAIAQPSRLWALGLVATTAEPVSEKERRERLAMADEVERIGMQPLIDAMAPRLFGKSVSEAISGPVLEMMRHNNPRGAAAALRGRASRPDYRPGLRALTTPSFVCVGTLDSWSTEEVTAELIRALRSPTVVRVPQVGHLPNLEEPAHFNIELTAFLMAAGRQR